MQAGTRVWIRDGEVAWAAGVVERVEAGRNGGVALASQTLTLTAANIAAGYVDISFTNPANGKIQAVSANYMDAAGNAASDTAPTDSAYGSAAG